MGRFGLEEGPWCKVNFCSTTAVTRPRTFAGGSSRVTSTESPTKLAIDEEKKEKYVAKRVESELAS